MQKINRIIFSTSLAVVFSFTVGCTSGSNNSVSNPDQNPQNSNPPPPQTQAPNEKPGAPVAHDLILTAPTGTALKYNYAEALSLEDGGVALFFYTRPPVTMCNPSSLLNSSDYETNFHYIRIDIPRLQSNLFSDITIEKGTRGRELHRSRQISTAKVNFEKINDLAYQGWISASFPDQTQLSGNYKISHCDRAEEFLESLSLKDIRMGLELHDVISGDKKDFYLQARYSENTIGNIQKLVHPKGIFDLSLDDYNRNGLFKIYGTLAGNYLTAGNLGCKNTSRGPAVAELAQNSFIGLNRNSTFACELEYPPKDLSHDDYFKITKSTDGSRAIDIYMKGRHYQGSF